MKAQPSYVIHAPPPHTLADDWRSTSFVPENLESSVAHADALKPLVPPGMAMAEMALRFILSNPDVSAVVPGMRKHRWDRKPTEWSQ